MPSNNRQLTFLAATKNMLYNLACFESWYDLAGGGVWPKLYNYVALSVHEHME